jgi:bacterioferritin-associated ferredoxin
MACPCCDQSRCCCIGESPLNYTTNYRRITSVATAGDCAGTVISKSTATSPCTGATILVQWCGLSVELRSPNTSAIAQAFPNAVGRGCGTGNDNVVSSQTLEIVNTSAGLYSTMGWGAECGRCVFRFFVTFQEGSFECGSRTRQFLIDWRQGCDTSIHVEFFVGDSEFFICNDLTPTVSITFAP